MALGRLLALIAVVGFGPVAAQAGPLWQEQPPRQVATANPAAQTATAAKAETLPDFTRMANLAISAVVSIATVQQTDASDDPIRSLLEGQGGEQQKGLGSGFFINPAGYFVTNAHVIEDATNVTVTVRGPDGHGREYPARIIGVDAPTDVALMKVDAEDGATFPTLPLGDSDALSLAEWIAVVGNPYGLTSTVTVGVVSYKGRTDVMPAGRDGYYDYIQTDASINPGNSGGPVLNANGQVIAIANAVNAVGQGIGFAIPINMVKQVLMPLLKEGRVHRSWMGVTVEDLTPDAAKARKVAPTLSGVVVSDVAAGAPGATAGLRTGDIITTFDGQKVADAQRLRWLTAIAGNGRTVPVRFVRDGRPQDAKVTLGPMPEEKKTTVAPQLSEVGLVVAKVDVSEARHAGLALPFGASVTEVRDGSPAERAGVRKGDLILKVDEQEIHSPGTLPRAFAKVESNDVARVVVRRGDQTQFLTMRKP